MYGEFETDLRNLVIFCFVRPNYAINQVKTNSLKFEILTNMRVEHECKYEHGTIFEFKKSHKFLMLKPLFIQVLRKLIEQN